MGLSTGKVVVLLTPRLREQDSLELLICETNNSAWPSLVASKVAMETGIEPEGAQD